MGIEGMARCRIADQHYSAQTDSASLIKCIATHAILSASDFHRKNALDVGPIHTFDGERRAAACTNRSEFFASCRLCMRKSPPRCRIADQHYSGSYAPITGFRWGLAIFSGVAYDRSKAPKVRTFNRVKTLNLFLSRAQKRIQTMT